MPNFRASVGRTRKAEDGVFVQGPLDVLETPGHVTRGLLTSLDELMGPVLEPAAGSGRISRELRAHGLEVEGHDLRTDGEDFLARDLSWDGDLVTNPPYSGGRAEAFVRKALDLVEGRVAMLLQLNFLCSERRYVGLWRPTWHGRPSLVLIVPYRIYFYDHRGRRIDGQAYDHAWYVWPPAAERYAGQATRLSWMTDVRTPMERHEGRHERGRTAKPV